MGRRTNGEGSVYQRGDGLWVASIMHDGRRYTAYAKSEREARGKLRGLRDKAYSGAGTERRTLAELVDQWLASDPALRETTRRTYRKFLRLYALPALGDVRLDRLTPEHLQAVYAELTPAQADKTHRILHRALAVAVRWRWIRDNPCDRALRPRYEAKPRIMWSASELQTFIEGVADQWHAPLWTLLIATGLRIGEALALTWDDVGLGVAVNVNGTLYRMDGRPGVNAPKTAAGRRTVLLPPLAVAALQQQRTQQDGWREAARNQWHEGGYVFTNATGEPLQHGTVLKALRTACARLSVPRMTPHALRHLHASLLIAEGVPITAVSARLGHANPGITLSLYSHALPGQDQQAADAISRALEPTDTKRK